jgi:hypothetical protein
MKLAHFMELKILGGNSLGEEVSKIVGAADEFDIGGTRLDIVIHKTLLEMFHAGLICIGWLLHKCKG